MLLRTSAVGVLVLSLFIMTAVNSAQARQIKVSASSCSCECVEGLPQTLCTSVQAAQQQTWVCPPSHSCPLPSVSSTGEARLFGGVAAGVTADVAADVAADVGQQQTSVLTPPHPQAENCRAVRVWHRQMQAYTTVNICDVQAPRI